MPSNRQYPHREQPLPLFTTFLLVVALFVLGTAAAAILSVP